MLDAQFSFAASASVSVLRSTARPETTLRRLATVSMQPISVPLYNGYPKTPITWIQAPILVSAAGEFFGDRPAPSDVDLGTSVRFLATSASWDSVGFAWYPFVSSQVAYFLDGAPGTSPTLTDFSYRRGKEIFDVSALTFAPGQFLTSSFNTGFDDSIELTISMVLAMRPGTPYTVLSSTANNFQVDLADHPVLTQGLNSSDLTGTFHSSVSLPVYLVLVLSPGLSTLYLSYGPGQTWSTQVVNTLDHVDMIFTLAQDTLGFANAAVDVMEISFDPVAQNAAGVNALVASYSSIYGTSNG